MSEFEKVQCTCAHGYTCRAMKDPSCCAHNCDYNDVVDALDKVTAERDAALAREAELVAQVETLKAASQPAVVYLTYTAKRSAGAERALTELARAMQSTPTKCMRDIQAEAVQGYLTALSAELDRKGMVSPSAFGEKYIKQLKAGEV